jgi:hypothetical protein
MKDLRNLWRDIDALGGAYHPNDREAAGYAEALDDVAAILERYGFAEGVAPVNDNPESPEAA